MNLPLQLDRNASIPLQDQLFEQLRQLILTGRLKPNTRVIATRFLAEQVGVSRRTVLFAYERLISEGYLEARPAVGTFVSPMPPKQTKLEAPGTALADAPRHADLYPPKTIVGTVLTKRLAAGAIDFAPSEPGPLLAPKAWSRWLREVTDSEMSLTLETASQTLRPVIANHIAATRGILASPEQIIIVSGRRHACNLVAALFQQPGDHVVLETPGDPSIAALFAARQAVVTGIAVDEHGLKTDLLPQGPVALVYVTPTRQNPVGGVMPQTRRSALIAWARGAGAYVLEDDSDCDLRYQGVAQPPLATLDPYGSVFYVGSFGKTLGAGLSLGYLVVPPDFIDPVQSIRAVSAEDGQWFEQLLLSHFLASGEYDHHLRRLRKFYLERRDTLIAALRAEFGEVMLIGTESGTQLTWLLPDTILSAKDVCDAALADGVHIEGVTGDEARSCRFYDRALYLSYGTLPPEQLQRGVRLLGKALRR